MSISRRNCTPNCDMRMFTALENCWRIELADKDPNEWKYVAKGSCEKMGGKMEPPKA